MGTAKYLNSRVGPRATETQVHETAFVIPQRLSFSTTVASAGTVATLALPATGQRFRVLGGWVTPSAADTVFLRGVTSTNFQLNVRNVANGFCKLDIPPGGQAFASANAALVLDTGAGGTIVTGTIFYSEEA